MKKIVVTIDGPAASGKSTISRLLADRLGFDHLSTGIFYRALAYYIIKKGVTEEDFLKNLDTLTIDVIFPNKVQIEELVMEESLLHSVEISDMASKIAKIKRVREFLLGIQRKIIGRGNIVADGRDVGTVVYPEADYKFFLTASSSERARRRVLELKLPLDKFFEIKKEIEDRDKRDKLRPIAPLLPSHDAYIVDSTYRTKQEVIDIMYYVLNRRKV